MTRFYVAAANSATVSNVTTARRSLEIDSLIECQEDVQTEVRRRRRGVKDAVEERSGATS